MRVLIVDNYDSFTFNLFQVVGELTLVEAEVVRNDAIDLAGIRRRQPTHVIVSPGPGHPAVPRDFGVSKDVIVELSRTTPVLGVCLGHQGIAAHLGGRVVRAPEIVHGKTSRVRHRGTGLFAGLPSPLEVMRYHSLIAERESLPPELEVVAELEGSGLVMGLAHKTRPLFGVQFHPESIGTPSGAHLLRNFLRMGPTR